MSSGARHHSMANAFPFGQDLPPPPSLHSGIDSRTLPPKTSSVSSASLSALLDSDPQSQNILNQNARQQADSHLSTSSTAGTRRQDPEPMSERAWEKYRVGESSGTNSSSRNTESARPSAPLKVKERHSPLYGNEFISYGDESPNQWYARIGKNINEVENPSKEWLDLPSEMDFPPNIRQVLSLTPRPSADPTSQQGPAKGPSTSFRMAQSSSTSQFSISVDPSTSKHEWGSGDDGESPAANWDDAHLGRSLPQGSHSGSHPTNAGPTNGSISSSNTAITVEAPSTKQKRKKVLEGNVVGRDSEASKKHKKTGTLQNKSSTPQITTGPSGVVLPAVGTKTHPVNPTQPRSESHKKKRKDVLAPDSDAKARFRLTTGLPSIFTPPLSGPPVPKPADKDYEQRVLENSRRPDLMNTERPIQVWATRRAGLTSTLEYFQNPSKVEGGSVEIGGGGVARAIMLEGDRGDGYVFWGVDKSSGTLVFPFGDPRPIQKNYPFESDDPVYGCGSSGTSTSVGETKGDHDLKRKKKTSIESKEITALLLAHRARVPIVAGVSEDYDVVPFKVPYPYVILGLFYITDAWLEPVGTGWTDPDRNRETHMVRWRFRIDYCKEAFPRIPWFSVPPLGPTLFQTTLDKTPESKGKWTVKGKGCLPTESVRLPRTSYMTKADGKAAMRPRNGFTMLNEEDRDMWHICEACSAASLVIYLDKPWCFNETCDLFFRTPEQTMTDPSIPRKIILRPLRDQERISPADLAISVRPKPSDGKFHDVDPRYAGKDFWKGFCCAECGMANERSDWRGWICDACGSRYNPSRRIWKALELVQPMRPISTGPRLDEGYPDFPTDVANWAAIWDDGVKICTHVLKNAEEIHHALAHEGNGFNDKANNTFEALQAQGRDEVALKRTAEIHPNMKVSDIALSDPYTFLCGPDSVPSLQGLPASKSAPWSAAPSACFDTMMIINHIAGRILKGEREFGSLMLMSSPSNANHTKRPWVEVPEKSCFAFLTLGSEVQYYFRYVESEGKRKPGKGGNLTAQHGDLIIVRTFDTALQVGIKPLGFAIIGIGRQLSATGQDSEIEPLVTRETVKEPPGEPREWPGQRRQRREVSLEKRKIPSIKDLKGWTLGGESLYNPKEDVQVPTSEPAITSNRSANGFDEGKGKGKGNVMEKEQEQEQEQEPPIGNGQEP